MQAVGENALPEVQILLRNELVPVAEGCNVRQRQNKIIRSRRGCEGPAKFSSRGMYEEIRRELGRPHGFLVRCRKLGYVVVACDEALYENPRNLTVKRHSIVVKSGTISEP